jgi:hypothetical protein
MTSWFKMKRLLNSRFLPPDFEQRLFQQYQECRQGVRTFQAYVDDFYRLSAHNDLMETEAQLVARFIGGLCLPIQDKVSMQRVFTLTEAVSLATRAEKQLERSKASTSKWNSSDSGRAMQNPGKRPMVLTGTTVQPLAPGRMTTGGSNSEVANDHTNFQQSLRKTQTREVFQVQSTRP